MSRLSLNCLKAGLLPAILKISGKVPLRIVLVVPFVVQISAAVGLTGYLSFRNGQKAVNDLANQLQQEAISHIEEKLNHYLEFPHIINKINVGFFQTNQLNLQNLNRLEINFWQQLKIFDSVSYIQFRNVKGDFRGVGRLQGQTSPIIVEVLDSSISGDLYRYGTDNYGKRTQLLGVTRNYINQTEIWYEQTVKAGKPTWSSIYNYAGLPILAITAGYPIYDSNGKLKGVMATDVILSDISAFLRETKISPSEQKFIIERSGLLVASSTDEAQVKSDDNQDNISRIKASDSTVPLIKMAANTLKNQFGNLHKINRTSYLHFQFNGKHKFVQVTPFSDGMGLDWLIVVVVGEEDFMGQINNNTRTTILLCLVALVVATIAGVITSRWVIQPILKLNTAAKELAVGQWHQPLEINREDELGMLAKAFNKMAEQLQGSFAAIEAKNAQMKVLNEALIQSESRLTEFLEAMPVGVTVIDENGIIFYANQKAHNLLGKTVVSGSSDLTDNYYLYKIGTNQLYPKERLPSLRALKGETSTADDLEIHSGESIIPLEVWATPVLDNNGKVNYAIVAFQDITERKKAEADRAAFIQELFKVNRELETTLEAEVKITESYGHFVPHQFLYFLGYESIVDVKLGDAVQQEMSVLFCDIRDFTSLSETMTPEDNFKFINSYLSWMEPAIAENNGFIDKYIGDGIMALFSGGADDAVKAGISMLKRLEEYNLQLIESGAVPIQIGIGINTGSLMLGTVGGEKRMDSTVIGDAVNLAARLEGLTKNYGVPLLISHETFYQLYDPPTYAIRPIDKVKVKGKSEMVSVFEVFEADPPEVRHKKISTSHLFIQAWLMYNQRNFSQAQQLFEMCLLQNPWDRVAEIYLQRCQQQNSLQNG